MKNTGIDSAKISKILVCAYIIIALLALNTIILLVQGGDGSSSSSSNSSTTEVVDGYDTSMMEAVSVEDILGYFDDGSTQVIYMGRASCSACVDFLPALQQAQDDYGFTTLYLDIETVSESTDAFNEFVSKLDMEYTLNTSEGEQTDEFGAFYGYTPAVVIIKDGKMVDGVIGGLSQDAYNSFLEENGFTK